MPNLLDVLIMSKYLSKYSAGQVGSLSCSCSFLTFLQKIKYISSVIRQYVIRIIHNDYKYGFKAGVTLTLSRNLSS